MDRDPQERIWPYITLVICLLILAIAAPRYWRWQEYLAARELPARRASGDQALFAGESILSEGPERDHSPLRIEAGSAVQKQTVHGPAARLPLWWDAAGEPGELRLDHVTAAQAAGGLAVPIHPPVASLFLEASDEIENEVVLPPAVPAGDSPRPADVTVRLARQLRLAARERQPDGEFAVTVWPQPTALVNQLQAISGESRSEAWAADVLANLAALREVPSIASQPSQDLLTSLAEQARNVRSFVMEVRPPQLQMDLISAAEALHRRVIVWQQVQQLAHHHEPSHLVSTVSEDQLHDTVEAAIQTISTAPAQTAWRRYLLLDDPQTLDALRFDASQARFVLERLHSPRLDRRQLKTLATPAMQQLDGLLRKLATEPVDAKEVIYAMEQYELTRDPADGERLADAAARWRWSTDDGAAELVRRMDANYRAANARAAITGDLLNRLLPKPQTQSEDVSDTIAGSYVEGVRSTDTNLAVRLIPDEKYWRLGMEARGVVNSSTTSYAGNASFFTQGTGRFAAQKLIVADHHHVHVWPAAANVRYQGQLQGVSTSLDGLPLVNRIAQNRAMEGYHANQYAAQQEVEARLKKSATKILDEQAHGPIFAAEAQLQRQLLQPLARASVEPATIRLYTTDQRIVGHWRMAGASQLGGHTARPWAPQDSLLSLQIHESAINNVLAGLDLDGRQAQVQELCSEVYSIFGADGTEASQSLPEDMSIRFADDSAVRVRFTEGHMVLTLQIAELRTQRRVWFDLIVQNDYAPDPTSLDAPLVRESSVRLKAGRLSFRDQLALRGIFTKLFSSNDRFSLIPAEIAEHPRLSDLTITQFLVRDGWVAVAVGPGQDTATNLDAGAPLDREAHRRQSHVR